MTGIFSRAAYSSRKASSYRSGRSPDWLILPEARIQSVEVSHAVEKR
jgi:hypothetical protein